jgi:hypothetical protein
MAAGFPFQSMAMPARGFYVIRRVRADTPQDAERQAIAVLQTEERYHSITESTQQHGRVELESVTELSWFSWHFSREPRGFIFYTDENAA